MKTPQAGPDYRPGGARWCAEHKRLECSKQRRHGAGVCHMIVRKGIDACTRHAGVSQERITAKGTAEVAAWVAMANGDVPNLDPALVVLGVLQMSWLRLQTYGELLRKQVVEDVSAHRELAGIPSADDPSVFDLDFEPEESVRIAPGAGGLIGYTIGAAGKDGVLYRQSEQVRAMVSLEASERDRVVKYAEIAHKMGISTRLTDLAERWGDVVATRVSAMLEALELTPVQQAMVPALLAEHLGNIDIGGSDTP